ncbi:MAG: hypothetical protein R3C01_04110 [Planctomycetaceae bacterium]
MRVPLSQWVTITNISRWIAYTMGRFASQVGLLTAALFVVALVLAVPAWRRYGELGLQGVGWGMGASLFPGLLMILVSGQVTGADRALKLLLFGMALRVGSVLGIGWLALQVHPELGVSPFYICLALFYMVALAVETRLLMAEVAAAGVVQGGGDEVAKDVAGESAADSVG